MFAVFPTPRKLLTWLFLPIMALLLAACEPIPGGGTNTGPSIQPSDPVPVALLVPSGSGSATDEILAKSLENAARLAMRDLNGVQIDLRVYSTAGNAQKAAQQATRAVDEGAKIILGPVFAASANAVGVAVAGDNVNVLSFSNNAAIAGGNVFVLGPTFQNTANRMMNFARAQGKSKVVVVRSDDAAGAQGLSAIQTAAASRGASVVGTVSYTLSQQDVVASIPRIKDTIAATGADSLFLTTESASALPLLAQLLPEAGVSGATIQFMGLTRWDIPSQTLSLPGIQGGWFAIPDPGASSLFSGQYRATYGSAPHPIGGLAFDGIAAIGALVSQGDRQALTKAALTQSAGFLGASGAFRFLSNGTNERALAVATIQDAQVVTLSPAPTGFGRAGF